MRRTAIRLSQLCPIALVAALLPSAGQAQHQHHHPPPKPAAKPAVAKPAVAKSVATRDSAAGDVVSAAGSIRTQRIVQNNVAVELMAPAFAEHEPSLIKIRISDAKSGAPLTGLAPAAWIDRRAAAALTDAGACRTKVDKYVQASTNMEQALKARAVVDLNSYFVLALNRGPTISVIDPFLGFGRTKLYTTVRLASEGYDWKLSSDQDRLYVTMPAVGKVAVVNTDNWKVLSNVDAGPRPVKVAVQPDQKYLWITNAGTDSARTAEDSVLARGGVTVIDRTTLKPAARVATGVGPHAVAFSDDSRFAFVVSQRDGTLSVIDVERLAKVKELKLGARPVDLAYSPVSKSLYVVDELDGTVAIVDGTTFSIVKVLKVEPGVRTIRFAPTTGLGHGAHAAHTAHGGAAALSAAGRIGFVLNPRRNMVTVLDASKNVVMRTTETGVQPDQVAFTTSFAYVRSAGSPEVVMIPLADPAAGGVGELDKFPAGGAAPSGAGELSEADAIVSAPDMPDAVYVMNPKERMIYYFHYMEGMPIPSGGLTTYGFQPKAVLVAGKDLRETEPGTYEATVKLTTRGDYDLIFLLDDPRVVHCFTLAANANPKLRRGRGAVDITPVAERLELRTDSANVVRFKLTDMYTGEARPELEDVRFILTATSGWRQRGAARHVGDGVYELTVSVPTPGVYYMSFEIPSIGLRFSDRAPMIWRAGRR
jgi:DNA-binding beta-propeller fold protein YncE